MSNDFEMERDTDCRTITIRSLAEKPVAYSKQVHFSDDAKTIEEVSLFSICLPDKIIRLIKENCNWVEV